MSIVVKQITNCAHQFAFKLKGRGCKKLIGAFAINYYASN